MHWSCGDIKNEVMCTEIIVRTATGANNFVQGIEVKFLDSGLRVIASLLFIEDILKNLPLPIVSEVDTNFNIWIQGRYFRCLIT